MITSRHAVIQNSYDDEKDVEPGENYQQKVEAVPHVLRKVLISILFNWTCSINNRLKLFLMLFHPIIKCTVCNIM